MIEVTKSNFNYIYPQVAFAIENAHFVSIDTEFSGLTMNEEMKPSLFDSIDERYQKLRKSVICYSVLEVGITTFKGNVTENQYDVTSYNFHLCPASFCSLNPILSLEASAIEFLNKHNFDFDKCFKEGIPYMNHKQKLQATEDLNNGHQLRSRNSHDFEEEIQRVCSLVASWIMQKSEPFLTLPLEEVSDLSLIAVHEELRRRFCQIWTTTNQFNQIVVERVSPERRKLLEDGNQKQEEAERKTQLLDALGFTRVFQVLERCKKPIIGHNMFMDLLFMYDKFHNPLPGTFTEFKEGIHELFPVVFDTKHVHYRLKKEFEVLKVTNTRKLDDLHELLNSQKVIGLSLMHPSIHKVINENFADDAENSPHHAGYDAFQCGCVFLRLCHLKHFKCVSHTEMNPVRFSSYLATMKSYANCVNVIRAPITHINLGGEEPDNERPPLLHVSVVNSKEHFTQSQLSSWFSVYGIIDIQMIGSSQAIVATSNYIVARDILYSFKKHPVIRVTRYKFWQHSRCGKLIWWGSFLIASGTCMFLVIDILRK